MNSITFLQRTYGFLTSRFFRTDSPICIGSACSSSYFGYLIKCLLPSVKTYEPSAKFILFDLGLEDEQIKIIKDYMPDIDIRPFKFDLYPKYYKDLTSFAWMSACVGELMMDKSLPDKIIWLDTKDVLINTLSPTMHLINFYGFYSPYSRTTIGELTYSTTIKLFSCLPGRLKTKNIEDKQMLNTSVMGFSKKSAFCQEIIWDWMQLSKVKDLIQPDGSNRRNHRQDQSLLSLIYYSKKESVPIFARTWYKIKLHQDSANLD